MSDERRERILRLLASIYSDVVELCLVFLGKKLSTRQVQMEVALSSTAEIVESPSPPPSGPVFTWTERFDTLAGDQSAAVEALVGGLVVRDRVNPAQLVPTLALASQTCLERMTAHLLADSDNERGGLLLGRRLGEGRNWVSVLTDVIPFDGLGNLVRFEFTKEAWVRAQPLIQQAEKQGQQIVGWYHSHPGHGIFLSGTDMHTQSNFFAEPWQIAIVFDPHKYRADPNFRLTGPKQNIGFFAGRKGLPCAWVQLTFDLTHRGS